MLGYGRSDLKTSIGSGGETDIAYGVGANFGFTDNAVGKVEYMNYYDDELEITGAALGLEFRF